MPIRGSPIGDVTFGHRRRNDLSDLTLENIEEGGISVSSERSEKNGTFAEHRVTRLVVEIGEDNGILLGQLGPRCELG